MKTATRATRDGDIGQTSEGLGLDLRTGANTNTRVYSVVLMSDPIPPATRHPSAPNVKPTALQAGLTFAGGLVLAAGSCAGFLATLNLNRESAVNITFALGFFASLIAALVGVVLIVVRVVRLARRRREQLANAPGDAIPSDGRASTPVPPTAPRGTAAGAIEGGPAWTALVVAGVLFAAAVGFVFVLVAADASRVAVLFLVLAAASMVGSLLSLVVAAVRYTRGR
jgi:hypothetical protein